MNIFTTVCLLIAFGCIGRFIYMWGYTDGMVDQEVEDGSQT